jgi:3-dehydroquinate synthase
MIINYLNNKTEVLFEKKPFDYLKNINRKILIVTDEKLSIIYKTELEGFSTVILPTGEASKEFINIEYLSEIASNLKINKGDLIVAFGGGAISDITGFFSSIYKRGIEFNIIPTTLLSMVDSSIGGKNGINMKFGKNQLGTIYQPTKVIINTDFLKTLNKIDLDDAYGEILKYALIDENFKAKLEKGISLEMIVSECIEIKGAIVSKDEFDTGIRNILNLGHTVGHGLEKEYKITHGRAVLIGLYFELEEEHKKEYLSLCDRLGIKMDTVEYDLSKIFSFIEQDKKNKLSKITIPIFNGKHVFLKEFVLEEYFEYIYKINQSR